MKRQALLVGSFVIGALVLAVLGIFALSGNNLFSKQQKAIIYFKGGVAGLYVGAPVSFRGVPVGQVEDIGIEVDRKTLAARIPVRIRVSSKSVSFSQDGGASNVPPDLPSLVQRGLRAKLVAQSFVTGQKAIDLDFVRNPPPVVLAGADNGGDPEIPVIADRFEALFDQVAQLPLRDTVREVRETMQSLKTTLESTRGVLEAATQQITGTAEDARKTLQTGNQTLLAATSALQKVQASADASLASVTRLADATRETVQTAQPELQRTLVTAREAAESANLAMSRVAELTAPGAPLRSDLDSSMRDLSQAARGLREWSELLEQQPNAVIFGRDRK